MHLLTELPWPPSVNHYYRHWQGRTMISAKGRKYRQAVRKLMQGCRPMEGELEITVDCFPPDKRRRDLDNLLKALLDSLQHAGAYMDDSQIKKIRIEMLEPERPDGRILIGLKTKEKK